MGDVKLTPDPKILLKSDSQLTLKDGSMLQIKSIDKVKDIDPVAVHLKEVNHIDPISIDSLHVSEVKNIDPIEITRFNVTNLPMVNVSLQKLPAVDFNVKSLPPVSVGTHQNFCIPSDYTLRARVLGIELVRLHLNGKTSIIPKERARREQARSDNRSFPETSVAGNPAIPSHCESSSDGSCNPRPQPIADNPQLQRPQTELPQAYITPTTHELNYTTSGNVVAKPNVAPNAHTNTATAKHALSFGAPRAAFQLPDQPADQNFSEHRVMSGD
jgi:hypothetical protein